MNRRSDTLQDISLLYELSLSIGGSLSLEENAEAFMRTLLSRKPLDFGCVWVRLPDNGGYRAVSAVPAFRLTVSEVGNDHPLFLRSRGEEYVLIDPSTEDEALRMGVDGREGFYCYLRLGNVGFLQLHSQNESTFAPRFLNQLRSIVDKLAVSLSGCIAHEELAAVTERHRATNVVLRSTSARLSTLITNLQAGILVEDENNQLVLVNERFCGMVGVTESAESLTGIDCSQAIKTVAHIFSDPEEFLSLTENALKERRVVANQLLQLKDGRTYSRDYVPVIHEGEYIGHLWQYSDVTQARRAVTRLEESSNRLSSVIETVGEGITLSDSQGFFHIYNSHMETITGFSVVEASEPDYLERIYPDAEDRQTALDRLKVLLSGQELRNIETTIRAKDGSSKTLLVSSSMIPLGGKRLFLSAYRDITERKRADEKLEGVRHFYQQVLESVPVQLAVFDRQGRYAFVSPSAVSDPELRTWLIGKTDRDYVRRRGLDPEIAENRMAAHAQAAQKRQIIPLEEQPIDRDGRRLTIARFASPVIDKNGEVTHVVGYGIDITELKEAERALAANEERYRQIIEHATDIIYRADSRGRFTFVNDVTTEILGYVASDLVGKPFWNFVTPDWAREVRLFYLRQLRAKTPDTYLEFPVLHADGRRVWLGQNVKLILSGDKAQGVQAIARDITDRRVAMEAERVSQMRKEAMLESALDGVLTVDESGEILEYNASASEMFGGVEFKILIDGEASEMASVFQQWSDDGFGRRTEVVGLRSDGSTFPLEMAVAPIRLDSRTLFTAYLRDITERKNTMQALVTAREEAESATRVREQFLANMSHEFRTPMNAINGIVHLLGRTELDSDQAEFVDSIARSTDVLMHLISDILDVAKLGSGTLEFETKPFSVERAVRDVTQMVALQAADKNIELTWDVEHFVPDVIVGDPYRLRQILLNLLSNAVKFTEEGSVTLAVEVASLGVQRVHLRFRVKDTGIGISAEDQARIFESFAQASVSTTRKFGGTGLGLAIVKQLAELQRGSVSVESTVGEGSEFVVEIPYQIGDATALDGMVMVDDHAESDALLGRRLLVVEDNAMNQFVARTFLTGWGAEVEVASNGRIAVDILAADADFDLVLMDIQMPELDGHQATRIIREDLGLTSCRLPIVALTASSLRENRKEVIAAGMNGFLLKPFQPRALLETVLAHERQRPAGDGLPEKMLDLSFLQNNSRGDPAFVNRILELYLEHTPRLLDSLEAALAAQNVEEVGRISHRLKSSVRMVGMSEDRASLEGDIQLRRRDGRFGVGVARAKGPCRCRKQRKRGRKPTPHRSHPGRNEH